MVITVAALSIGLVIGLARGGRVRNLTLLPLRWPALGAAGIVALVAARAVGAGAPELLLATGWSMCAIVAFRNVGLVGFGVIGLGLLANLAPLLANGTIPVDADALVHAGIVERADLDRVQLDGGRSVAGDATLLAPLGQTIPIPELGVVLSFGDLLVALGLADAVNVGVRRRRRVGGIPVAEVFAADDVAVAPTIDLTDRTGTHREHPVEVSSDQPVPIPMGWGPDDGRDRGDDPVGAGAPAAGHRQRAHRGSTTHVPWPWRRVPPQPHHPTMRVRN